MASKRNASRKEKKCFFQLFFISFSIRNNIQTYQLTCFFFDNKANQSVVFEKNLFEKKLFFHLLMFPKSTSPVDRDKQPKKKQPHEYQNNLNKKGEKKDTKQLNNKRLKVDDS